MQNSHRDEHFDLHITALERALESRRQQPSVVIAAVRQLRARLAPPSGHAPPPAR